MLVQSGHRIAAALSAIFLALAAIFAVRYRQAHGGWDITSGSSELMTIMLLVLGFVFALSFALFRPGSRNTDGTRAVSIVWSLALLVCLGFTWNVIVVADRWVKGIGTLIDSPQAMDAFFAENPATLDLYDYQVPTGVFMQSFEFLDSHNVEVTGYVWQTYAPDIPWSVTRGVVFPEALKDAYKAGEAWRVKDEEGEHIGWYFSGKFRQNFDYRLYPFDRQDIWLRLWHPDPQRNVLLVPDFASYSNLAPGSLPGIERDFVYGGWDPVSSEFSYGLVTYNTTFGRAGQLNGTPYADLYFNLSLERDFLSPILEHVVLESAIAILLFFLLLLMAYGTQAQEQTGLTVFDLIVAAGGLLFAVILDHNSIRSGIDSQDSPIWSGFPCCWPSLSCWSCSRRCCVFGDGVCRGSVTLGFSCPSWPTGRHCWGRSSW